MQATDSTEAGTYIGETGVEAVVYVPPDVFQLAYRDPVSGIL